MKGNHRNPQPVIPVYCRKIARNKLKIAHGNSKIQQAWRKVQIKLYGFKQYLAMRKFKTPWRQRKELDYQIRNGLQGR